MEDLLIVAFPDDATAAAGLRELRLELDESGGSVEGAILVGREPDGTFRAAAFTEDELEATPVAIGTAAGGLAGAFAGPLGAAIGGLIGMAGGAATAGYEAFEHNLLVDAMSTDVQPGRAAIVAVIHEDSTAAVDRRMAALDGNVRRWTRAEVEEQLRAAGAAIDLSEGQASSEDG